MIKEVHYSKELLKAIKHSPKYNVIIYDEANEFTESKLLIAELTKLFERNRKRQEKAKEDEAFIRRLKTKP